MLCTFTTEAGNLIVQSDDIKEINDDPKGWAYVRWMAAGELYSSRITGTAIENRDRIQQEELDLIDRVNQHHLKAQMQAQYQQQIAALPSGVKRGKQATK